MESLVDLDVLIPLYFVALASVGCLWVWYSWGRRVITKLTKKRIFSKKDPDHKHAFRISDWGENFTITFRCSCGATITRQRLPDGTFVFHANLQYKNIKE